MHFEFEGEIIHWRGPAPFYFVAMPDEDSQFLKSLSNQVTYGWGVIPVDVTIGKSSWTAPYKRTYAEVPEGQRIVVVQSSEFVECAINKGSLTEAIHEGFGAAVSVHKGK